MNERQKRRELEKELKKSVKDVQPKKAQAAIKKLIEGIEKNSLVPKDDTAATAAAASAAAAVEAAGMSEADQAEMNALADELEEVVIQLEVKCSEVDEWKSNFESLQVRFFSQKAKCVDIACVSSYSISGLRSMRQNFLFLRQAS